MITEIVLTNVAQATVVSTRLKNVSAQFSTLNTYFTNADRLNEQDEGDVDLLVSDIARIFMSRIQVVNRDFKIISDTYQINKGKICISKYVVDCFKGLSSAFVDEENQCIIMSQPVYDSDGNIAFVIVAVSSITDIYSAMDSVRLTGNTIIIIMLVVVLFLAVFLSYTTAKPFRNIEEVISRIDRGHMTEYVNMKGCTEVEKISGSFNRMLERINQLEDSRQMFVSNVSHELKTPMTSMKVLADSILAQGDAVPNEMYRDFMEDLSN